MLRRLSFALIALAIILSGPIANAETVDKIVAIINDGIITLSELNAATAVAMDKLGMEDKGDNRKTAEIKTTILDSLIEQKLVKQAADRAGIDISEREIDNAVEDIKKQNGFTQEQLLLALAQSGLTQREYRDQLKEQIRQVKFINKEFKSKISIQPEDIEDYYRQNIKEFYGPATYRLNMIFLPSGDREVQKERLKLVKDALAKGDDFRDLASHYSEGPAASLGGDLGYIKSGEMDSRIEEAAAKLEINGISPPIETEDGIYFIQLADKKESAPRTLKEATGVIYDRLFKKIMDERFNFWLTEVKKFAHIEIRM